MKIPQKFLENPWIFYPKELWHKNCHTMIMIAGVDSYGKLTCIKNHHRHMLKTHHSRSDSNEILAIDKRSVWTLLFSFSLHWFFSFFTSFRFCLFRELSKSKHAKSHEFMIFIKFSDKKWAAFFFSFQSFLSLQSFPLKCSRWLEANVSFLCFLVQFVGQLSFQC